MMRALLVALALGLATPAMAQGVEPRTDVLELRRQAAADPAIKAALANKARPLESRLRDEGRMVDLILKQANAKPGERVLDVGSGGGYLARLFATLVGGPSGTAGHVDIHNTPGWIVQFPSMDPDVQRSAIKQPNIGWITTSWNELDAPADAYDLIMLGQVYHDIILESGDFEALNQRFFRMLKPGGRLVIEDHDAIETMSLGEQVYLHRISHGDVTGQLLSAGFRQTDMILMKSGHDDRRFNVFRPTLRGRTDRFIAVFEKPLDGKPLR